MSVGLCRLVWLAGVLSPSPTAAEAAKCFSKVKFNTGADQKAFKE